MSIWREEKRIKRPLLYITGGLVLGETGAHYLTAKQGFFALAVILSVFSCALLTDINGRRGKVRRWLAAFFKIVLLGALIGFSRMQLEKWAVERQTGMICQIEGETILVEGTIAEIRENAGKQRLILTDSKFKSNDAGKTGGMLPHRLYCYLSAGKKYELGMKLCVEGNITCPEPARNPGAFDYRLYCLSQGINGILYGEKAYIVSHPRFSIMEILQKRRRVFAQCIDENAEARDAGLLKAILLGDRTELEEDTYELYRQNGIAHILAISGLHISLIGMALWRSLRSCGIGYGMSGGIAWGILLLYGIMTGAAPSVIRAIGMTGIHFLAEATGRTYDLPSAAAVSACLLLLWRPFLLTQAAFQLSFLAVGAVYFPGGFLVKKTKAGNIAGMLRVSGSIQAVTAPAILFHSFEIPLYGIWINLLVVPLMTGVVISGVLGMFAALFAFPAAGLLFGGAHNIFWIYERAGSLFLSLPHARLTWGRPGFLQIAGAYIGILAAVFLLTEKSSIFRSLSGVVLIAALLILRPVSPDSLVVTFLDVGQGDCIFLQKGKDSLLVDCGSSQKKTPGKDILVPFLKSRGISGINAVAATHGDSDHINGIREILEQKEFKIKELILSEAGREDEASSRLGKKAEESKIPVRYGKMGDYFNGILGPDVEIICLYPQEGEIIRERNDQSLVFLIRYGEFRLLLTGDLEEGGERRLMEASEPESYSETFINKDTEEGLGPVTVLKVGHHGAATSSSMEFLEKISPKLAVLSYGRKNRYGHPAPDTVERLQSAGARLLGTGECGAIELRSDGRGLRIRKWILQTKVPDNLYF